MTFSQLPLVLFTLLSQIAIGASFFAAYRATKNPYELHAHLEWGMIATLTGLATLAGLCHLLVVMNLENTLVKEPLTFFSKEILSLLAFLALSYICYRTRGKVNITFAVAFVGLVALVLQSVAYAPVPVPATFNFIIPFGIFFFTGITLGALVEQWFASEIDMNFMFYVKVGLFILTAFILASPCYWSANQGVIHNTAVVWFSSPFYWAAVFFNVVAWVGLNLQLIPVRIHFVLILISAFFVRTLILANIPM